MKILLLGKLQHGSLGKLVHASVADEPFLTGVLTEENVEDDSYERHEREHKNPCHRLSRLPVVHQDGDDSRYHNRYIKQQINPMKIYHTFRFLSN